MHWGRSMADEFTVRDSGERREFESGMVRDTNEGKTLWHLVADGPMLRRFAVHLTKGAAKYSPGNWMKAEGQAEYDRFRESAYRHFMAWYYGERDEDHGAAVWFNINGAEYVRGKMHDSIMKRLDAVTPQELSEAESLDDIPHA